MAACGLDFGTSNSALGIVTQQGPRLVRVDNDSELIPTAIFFDLDNWEHPRFGQAAIDAAIGREPGRFLRGLKSILGSELFERTTQIGPHRITFASVIERFIRHLKAKAEETLGHELDSVVHGRPVHFYDGDTQADARAQASLETIVRKSGFKNVRFVYEPIAAAYHYETSVENEELVLVADIGGGTSDFSLIRIGPQRRGLRDRKDDILANTGRRLGGSDLDAALSLAVVMPLLGLGSFQREKNLPIPKSIYFELAHWATLPFVYSWTNVDLVRRLHADACEPGKLQRLQRTLELQLGHRIAFAAEAAKIALSGGAIASVDLEFLEAGLSCSVQRTQFELAIAERTAALTNAAVQCIRTAGINARQIGAIFFTGGSSRVPVFQEAVARAAPHAVWRSASDLLSVALGLTKAAQRSFG